MYQQYFGFMGRPFENTPDPERFFMGKQYRETLAVLMHSVLSRKVLTVITGDIGLGKTTLGRTLLDKMPENTKRLEIIHPRGKPGELLGYVAKAMCVDPAGRSHLELVDELQFALREHAANDGRCVLVIDESQLLTDEHFEEIRLLTNLETSNLKLIQVILLGQLELLKKLHQPNMRPLRQRIAMIKQLQPMSPQSTGLYVKDRLKGVDGNPALFPAETLSEVYRFSRGIPRLINQICDFALIYTYSSDRDEVSIEDVREAASDIGLRVNTQNAYVPSGESHRSPRPMPNRAAESRMEPELDEPPVVAESKTATEAISPPPPATQASPAECPTARKPEPRAQSLAPLHANADKRSRGGIWALAIILLLAFVSALLWLNHQGVISIPGLNRPNSSDSLTSHRTEEGAASLAEKEASPPAQQPDSFGSDKAVGKYRHSFKAPIKPQIEDPEDVSQNSNNVPTGKQNGEQAVTGKKREAGYDQEETPLKRTPGDQSINEHWWGAYQTGAGFEPQIFDTGRGAYSPGADLRLGSLNQARDESPGKTLPLKADAAPTVSDQESPPPKKKDSDGGERVPSLTGLGQEQPHKASGKAMAEAEVQATTDREAKARVKTEEFSRAEIQAAAKKVADAEARAKAEAEANAKSEMEAESRQKSDEEAKARAEAEILHKSMAKAKERAKKARRDWSPVKWEGVEKPPPPHGVSKIPPDINPWDEFN